MTEKQCLFKSLRVDARAEMVEEFQKMYPTHTLSQIDCALDDLNPIVTWNNEKFDGYHVWDAFKPKFEKILFDF